jgi:type I restriction enzyme, R subunit
MSGLLNKACASPNFAFLMKYDEVLVRHVALAERYVFDDPNSALIKLRQFGELLAQHAAAYTGVAVEEHESQHELLTKLIDRQIINVQVSQLFHGLRKSGNQAAHQHTGDRREALHQLQMARKLAVWFHKSFGGDKSFKAGPFLPPPDPRDTERELRTELERLREAIVATQDQIVGTQQLVEEHARQRQEAEAAAQRAYDDLAAALALATETEQQLEHERQQFQQRLAALQAQMVEAPAAQRAAVVEQAQHEAEALDLDEAQTRRIIDQQLREAGWEADTQALTYAIGARPVRGRNLAIAEWPTSNGPADYVLFVGLTPVAVVEAKRQRRDVTGAIEQARRYSRGYTAAAEQQSPGGPWGAYNVPFLFATNGRPFLRQIAEKSGIWFGDARQDTNHPRALEAWYTPEGLSQLLQQDSAAADARLAAEPTNYLPLRDYQEQAIRTIECCIAEGQRELLVAMATGTGKTITCIGLAYRLIKAKRFRRILFLVDRNTLGEQAIDKLQEVRLENLQTFPDIYDVKKLGDLRPEPETRLHIATVQGMVKRILYPSDDAQPVPVDWYDCVIIDECHRGYILDQEMSDAELTFRSESDYISKYRRVLDHFDAVRIGLTATPALHTTAIFGAPVFQYTYRQAVIDGWLVDHEPPYRLVTQLAEEGMRWERGATMKIYDTHTNVLQQFNTPDEVEIEVIDFNRKVITENFNRTICQALAAHIDPSLPGKTLIFCVNDLHADLVVRLLKEAFDDYYGSVPDDTVKKITGAADQPSQLIRRYKNEKLPRVAVTVDLLTTGVDVPEIVNLVFIRRVRSRILFEQMLGRATRLCPDLYGPGDDKQRFSIFDAVGIYDDLEAVTDMHPVVSRPSMTFTQLTGELRGVGDEAFRTRVKEEFLAKLRRKRFSAQQEEALVASTSMDRRQLIDHVRQATPQDLGQWFTQHPEVADLLDDVYHQGMRFLISEHADALRRVERGYGTATRPEDYLDSFRRFITEHVDQIPALLVVTQRPRDLTRAQLRELRIQLDQAGFSEAHLRTAWRETTNQDVAASVIGFIRHVALGQPLLAHHERVQAALQTILARQPWTTPQRQWLERIGKQLEQEVIVDREAIDSGQFKAMGGYQRLNRIFQGQLDDILHDLAEAMWQVAA